MPGIRFVREWPVHFQRGAESPDEAGAGCEASLEALHEVYDIAICSDADGYCVDAGRRVRRGGDGSPLPTPCLYVSAGFPCRRLLLYDAEGRHAAEAELTLHSTAHIAGVVSDSADLLRRYHVGRLHVAGQRLFVADCQYDCVYFCDLSGNVLRVVGAGGARTEELDTPMGVHFAHQLLAVCDSGNRRVRAFADDGSPAPLPGVDFRGRVRCCCFLPDARLCVADFESGDLRLYDIDGRRPPLLLPAASIDRPELLKEPFCVLPAVQPGHVLVSYSGIQGDHSVRLVDLREGGGVVAKIGGFGTGAGCFNKPRGMALDKDTGSLFVVDARNYRVQVFQL